MNPEARPPGAESGAFWAHDVQVGPALYLAGYGCVALWSSSQFLKMAPQDGGYIRGASIGNRFEYGAPERGAAIEAPKLRLAFKN